VVDACVVDALNLHGEESETGSVAMRYAGPRPQAEDQMQQARRLRTEGVAMTIVLEDALPEVQTASPDLQIVKCSWCGEIIRIDGHELALAMCQTCYDRMLGEFLRAPHANQTPTRPSDR
jgi:hypothetical protein